VAFDPPGQPPLLEVARAHAEDGKALIRSTRRTRAEQGAKAKLAVPNRVRTLEELKNPPSNRLHALDRDREGQHSLSINKQWRICFVWKDGDAHGVEIVDYH
jgi:proteic killer suppression protein